MVVVVPVGLCLCTIEGVKSFGILREINLQKDAVIRYFYCFYQNANMVVI